MKLFDVFDPNTPIKGKYFLEASAGTGKTFTIEQIVLRAVLEGSISHIDQVLAVTFTNAATNELKQRIRDNLTKAAHTLKQAVSDPTIPLPPYISPDQNVKQLYMKVRNALATVDRMMIFTIHGFCHYVLQQHFPNIETSYSNEALTHLQAIAYHIKQYLHKNLWRKVLFPRQFYLLSAKYDVSTKFSSSLTDKLIASFCNKIEKTLPSKQATLANLRRIHNAFQTQTLWSKEELQEQLDQHLSCFKDPRFIVNEDIPPFVESLYNKIPSVKLLGFTRLQKKFSQPLQKKYSPLDSFDFIQRLGVFKAIEEYCDIDKIFNTLLQDVQKYLKTHYTPWLSPDESISALDHLIKKKDSKLIDSLRQRFQLVLIDEFQDTDEKQWNIFSSLFAHKDFHGSLFLIGDPKQSIYEWRNADLNTYLKAKESFPQEAHLHLTNNYRSSPPLMEALNRLFTNSPSFLTTDRHTIYYHDLCAKNPHIFTTERFSPVHFYQYDNTLDLMGWLTITANYLKEEYHIPFGNMAILVSDSNQAMDIIAHSPLPTAFAKEKSVFKSTETHLLTQSWLEAILTPANSTLLNRVLLSCLFRLSLKDIKEKKNEFSSYFFSLNRFLSQHGLLATFYHFMSKQGEDLFKTTQGDLIYQEMEKICAHLDTISSHPQHQLLYLQYLSATGEGEKHLSFSSYSDDKEILKITTIHSSKGLEYDVVFAVGLGKPKLQDKSFSERMREMYVCCTRAKKLLFIPYQTSSRSESSLSLYLKKPENTFSSIEDFTSHYPHLFSQSSKNPYFSSSYSSIKLQEPDSFSLSPAPVKQIFSFSSVAKNIDLPAESLSESSLLIPRGKKTGVIIHSILENLAPYFNCPFDKILSTVHSFTGNTHLEGFEQVIAQQIAYTFTSPLSFSHDTFRLIDLDPQLVRVEEPFLFSNKQQLWQGKIDLFFEYKNRYYVIDWKTSYLGDSPCKYSPTLLLKYIQEHHLDYQGAIYTYAINQFLQQFDIEKEIEVGFAFIRGMNNDENGFVSLPSLPPFNPKEVQKYPAYH